jgi:spore germination protein (amino acid permease)
MLTKMDSAFLIMLVLPVMGHVIVLPLILDVVGRDAWISVLISLPFAILYGYLIYKLKTQYPGDDFRTVASHLLGKFLGTMLIGLFCLYFFFLCVISVAQLVDMIHIGFLPETPISVLVIWFMAFCLFAAKMGIKAIALTSGILSIFAIAIGYIVSFTSESLKDWGNLAPILEYGWSPVWMGALILISIWMELLFLLVVPLKNVKEKRLFLTWVVCILFNALIMTAAMTGVVMVFGLGQASNLPYPALEVVRNISLGFIDRLDTYALVLMSFGCYIRTSLYLRLTYKLSVPANPKWLHHIWLYGIWGGLLACCLYISANHSRLYHFSLLDVYGVVFFPLMVIFIGISWFKNTRPRIGV